MAWFKVDDRFWSHPKTAGLSDGATALWLRAGSWSAGHLTDGFVPESALRFFRGRRRSADELVAAGLWSAADGGFVFHDWDEYQPSKAQVTAKRQATKARVDAWRDRNSNGVTDASPEQSGNAAPDPTRPDPTEVPKGTSEGRVSELRPDVSRLCSLLADLIESNGSKRPSVGKGWLDAARLMIDVDGRALGEAIGLIQWCQADPFWRSNILSMPKFRERYDQLRLQRSGRDEKATVDPYKDLEVVR